MSDDKLVNKYGGVAIPLEQPPITMDGMEAENQKDINQRIRIVAITNRLNQWVASRDRLVDCESNSLHIQAWMSNHINSDAAPERLVDECIAALRPVLQFAPKAQPAVEETLPPLPNGEPRLPLDADERTLKAASTAQIQDWVKRTREVTGTQYLRPRGGFGSSF